ncbi:MAG: hypothetical protein RIR31_565 [Bacteroidota bacterium]|jgi:hypothetical protein
MQAKHVAAELALLYNPSSSLGSYIKKNPLLFVKGFSFILRLKFYFATVVALAAGFSLLIISASPKGLSFAKSTNIGAATNIEE